jgi:hypothetical protein
MIYAGIGSRSTPQEILNTMCLLASKLAEAGWTLYSGGAEGADEAFALGAEADLIDFTGAGGEMEIFLPWPGFNGLVGNEPRVHERPQDEAYDIAAEYHPYWRYLKRGARALMARNTHQILGWQLEQTVDRVICWTPDASHGDKTSIQTGGTGQALRMAYDLGVPVYNLADEFDRMVISDAIRDNNFDAI